MGTTHFQYEDAKDLNADQLFQGDVLERNECLEDVLKGLYPYAHQNPRKYPYFVVLTQSCDLIADNHRYRKAEHITICAARSIRIFLEQEVSKLQTPVLQEMGICLKRDKQSLLNKIERLLSNEEYPYFYLHPSKQTPFSDGLVAYLRVAFPLRTDIHYNTCLKAKKVQLAPEFQAKLGWLTTLVYGRVATNDFEPEMRSKYAKEYIDSIEGIVWRKEKALANQARQMGLDKNFLRLTPSQLRQLIDTMDVKSQPEALADLVVKYARELWPEDEQNLSILRRRLLKDTEFISSMSE